MDQGDRQVSVCIWVKVYLMRGTISQAGSNSVVVVGGGGVFFFFIVVIKANDF